MYTFVEMQSRPFFKCLTLRCGKAYLKIKNTNHCVIKVIFFSLNFVLGIMANFHKMENVCGLLDSRL